jgi:hypothetical protein
MHGFGIFAYAFIIDDSSFNHSKSKWFCMFSPLGDTFTGMDFSQNSTVG